LNPKLEHYARIIKSLNECFKPHDGQVKVGRALFQDQVKDIFVEAGRSWGKTYLMSYLLWRWAILNPGSQNYYFAPYMKQAREIIWAPGILKNFGPRDWINDENNTEMRIPFKNGSFVKADGSDNVNAYRGVKPNGLIIFDEFKDFREDFFEAFDPNRSAFDAPLIIIGTPPGRDCQFTRIRDEFKSNPSRRYFHGPSTKNPYISKDWLEKKRIELVSRGEEDVWQREYLAMQVSGGATKIFPMVNKSLVKPHEEILHKINRERKRMEWILWTDPAAASTFAVLFACHNPYTKEIFLLDELYEQDQARMTVKTIGSAMLTKKAEIDDKYEWRQGYDEAASWFQNEMLDNFGEHFEASQKAQNNKDSGLTLIKDIILQNKLFISDRCIKTFWEMDNYYKDKSGNIPKKDDHLVDCLRYILAALHYSLPETRPPEDPQPGNRTRIKDDFPQFGGL
jgi:hypothetical protein